MQTKYCDHSDLIVVQMVEKFTVIMLIAIQMD